VREKSPKVNCCAAEKHISNKKKKKKRKGKRLNIVKLAGSQCVLNHCASERKLGLSYADRNEVRTMSMSFRAKVTLDLFPL